VADLMHDTAFIIKDALGRYVVVNQSLVERHGIAGKVQMIGKRPSEVCPGILGASRPGRTRRLCALGSRSLGGDVLAETACARVGPDEQDPGA
jgi:hypothetical protein